MRIHVIGNLGRDTTLAVARFPVPGETLVARSCRVGLGGKGLNQAVAAARTGAAVTLHAAVGEDEAEAIAASLSAEAALTLRLTGLARPTDTSTVLVRPDGENAIVSASACAAAFDPLVALSEGDVLLMQGNLTPAVTRACLARGRRAGALTVLNPSPLWEAGTPHWPDVDLLVVNRVECAALAGKAEDGAATLLVNGVGAVAVTLGADGVLYRDATARIAVAAPAVAVQDTAGAGDVFCGVLVGLLAVGIPREAALARAIAAASLSVTRPGALASCPTTREIATLALPPVSFDP